MPNHFLFLDSDLYVIKIVDSDICERYATVICGRPLANVRDTRQISTEFEFWDYFLVTMLSFHLFKQNLLPSLKKHRYWNICQLI